MCGEGTSSPRQRCEREDEFKKAPGTVLLAGALAFSEVTFLTAQPVEHKHMRRREKWSSVLNPCWTLSALNLITDPRLSRTESSAEYTAHPRSESRTESRTYGRCAWKEEKKKACK